MATFTTLSLPRAKTIGLTFGLDVREVTPVPAGSVNSNYRLVCQDGLAMFCRIYEEQDQDGAEGEARLLDHLAERGIPTPRPLPRADGGGFTLLLPTDSSVPDERATSAKPVAIFPWREGEMRCQKSISPRIAHEIGRQLALVHAAGATFHEPRKGRFRIQDLRQRVEQIARADDLELRSMAGVLASSLDEAMSGRVARLPSGIVHGDLFRDNVLWRGDQVSALLDFESASEGTWVYDLMVTILAWCQSDELELPLVSAMFAGYQLVRRLQEEELFALMHEGKAAALRFTITRMTDFSMKKSVGDRVQKDWRRFWARYEKVQGIGAHGWSTLATAPRPSWTHSGE